ncbi:MAG: hypothetical protein AAFR16_13145, partial [Pseudomonadota bacterium]
MAEASIRRRAERPFHALLAPISAQKKARPKPGLVQLRQVSYRQETYRAVHTCNHARRPGSTRLFPEMGSKAPESTKFHIIDMKNLSAAARRSACGQVRRAFFTTLRAAAAAAAFAAANLTAVTPAAAESPAGSDESGGPRPAIAMHGAPALTPEFTHLPYADPDAAQGGRLRLGVTGAFDRVNPFLVRGVAARGVREHVVESLMAR